LDAAVAASGRAMRTLTDTSRTVFTNIVDLLQPPTADLPRS
jgi:hypothetical protein